MFGIQPLHLIVIFIVALVVFGPSRLPDMARGLGKALAEFRKATSEVSGAFMGELNQSGDSTAGRIRPDPPAVPTPPAAVPYAVQVVCPSCGGLNPAGARFCNRCGAAQAAAPLAPPELVDSAPLTIASPLPPVAPADVAMAPAEAASAPSTSEPGDFAASALPPAEADAPAVELAGPAAEPSDPLPGASLPAAPSDSPPAAADPSAPEASAEAGN